MSRERRRTPSSLPCPPPRWLCCCPAPPDGIDRARTCLLLEDGIEIDMKTRGQWMPCSGKGAALECSHAQYRNGLCKVAERGSATLITHTARITVRYCSQALNKTTSHAHSHCKDQVDRSIPKPAKKCSASHTLSLTSSHTSVTHTTTRGDLHRSALQLGTCATAKTHLCTPTRTHTTHRHGSSRSSKQPKNADRRPHHWPPRLPLPGRGLPPPAA